MTGAAAIIEVHGFSPAMVVLDAMEKAGDVRLLQAELNDLNGLCLKITGTSAALRAAVAAGQATAEAMHVACTSRVLDAPTRQTWQTILNAAPEFSPLIEAPVVLLPRIQKEPVPMPKSHLALGLIETQGFTAVIEALDVACKAADVEVIGKEKLGGGYITVLIRGDVAAVEAAIATAHTSVGDLGKLIAAHVIARPSDAVMSLLPEA